MEWIERQTTIEQNAQGEVKMADTTYIPQPQVDGFGGTIGGLLLGSLMSGRGGLFGNQGYGAGDNNAILQSLNQNQMAGLSTQIGNTTQQLSTALGSATQILTQDIFGSANATQNAVNNGVISSLQGFAGTGKDILTSTLTNAQGHTNILSQVSASAADTNANINSARQGISADIRDSISTIDADLHGIASDLSTSLGNINNNITQGRFDSINATHNAEINGMRNAFDTQRSIFDTSSQTQRLILEESSKNLDATRTEGSKTRDLINATTIQELAAELSRARNAHHHDKTVDTLTISNNNNNTAVATSVQSQLQAQQQQQQIANLSTNLASLLGHVNNIAQTSVQVGGRNNSVTPTAVGM
jgi:hypothetical protein